MSATEALLDPANPEEDWDGPPEQTPDRKNWWEQAGLTFFLVVPFLALIAAVPVFWGWGLTWPDVVIAVAFYYISGLGVTVGFHRCLTHRSFKAKRWLRVVLAICGSLALEGPAIQWVADHRRHHRFSDRDGDPHSPWRYGSGFKALTKGFWYSHVGWLFDWEKTSEIRYAPELVADPDMAWVSRTFSFWLGVSLLLPALIGGLWSWSWKGALLALFWGSLVRICVLHHVTFAINSVCHIKGRRPFRTRDRSQNVWWLGILSFGESWHNFHHAEPTSARHGVRLGEFDTSALVIRTMERLRWVTDVRWPDAATVARRRVTAAAI